MIENLFTGEQRPKGTGVRVLFRGMLVVFLLGVFGPASAQGEAPPNPADLAKLVSAVERLVNVLEKEAKARLEDRESARIQVLVSVLTIRYHKTDDLEAEIRDIESEEEQLHSNLTTIKARLESLEQTGRPPEEATPAEEKAARKILESEAKAQEDHLARLEERKVLAQNDLAAARRRLAQLESVLEEWVQKQH